MQLIVAIKSQEVGEAQECRETANKAESDGQQEMQFAPL